jgi:hypothetical protein
MALTQIKSTIAAPQAVGWVKLSVTTASDSTTVEVTSGFSTTYDDYMIAVHHAVPETNGTELNAQLYIDGAFRTDSFYNYHVNRSSDGSTSYAGSADNAAAHMRIMDGWGSATGEGCDGFFYVFNANEDAGHQKVLYQMIFDGDGGDQNVTSAKGVGSYHDDGYTGGFDTMVCAGVRFVAGADKIASGDFVLYGLTK